MDLLVGLVLFAIGVGLVVFSAERLVEGAVGTSVGFGISAFLVSVIFIGFDPENLAVGAVGALEGLPGIALGSVVGSAMVAIGLAFGVTAVIAPMTLDEAPARILAVPVLAVLFPAALLVDGRLGRLDGVLLLAAFGAALLYLVHLERQDVRVAATPERQARVRSLARKRGRWASLAVLAAALVGVVVGSELAVRGSERLMARFGLSDTVFGMTVLALAVSIEEVARELPAALQGRPDIAVGNVVGSVLAFFLFNAGVIALVRPVAVGPEVLGFYLPMAVGTVLLGSWLTYRRRIGRLGGLLLLLLYGVFFLGAYLGTGGP